MTDTLLRAPRAADRGAWGALWTAYLAFYETVLPPGIHDRAFARLLAADPDDFRGLIAWRGDAAIGLAHWLRHPHLWRPEGITYLQDLYVAPEARGGGVARALVEAVYANADARGAPRTYWITQEDNAPARALYDRVGHLSGFVRYDRPD